MPGLAHRSEQFRNVSSTGNSLWSKQRDDGSQTQLQKFWTELSHQARQELLKIDKQTLFEQARKNMYCSRCNGLLLEGFVQIVMYGKSLQLEGAGEHLTSNRPGLPKSETDCGSSTCNGCPDEIRDPTIHPWGGLTTTRDGSLTLLDCYLYSKSLKGLQNVFVSARARERERELLYPDACGGGGRGWISQGMTSYGRGHGTRETCALHTARLSCDTLVDFWSALGEETRQSLLRMKEEDFIERLMYRFDSKRFCRDCRRNVVREFKELKELKRMRRETRCTSWFCVADTDFQYEVSNDTIQADWRHTFTDIVGTYHHFEWAVGTGEGKSDILEYENVGMNGSVQVSGLDLGGFTACYITLRAWKLDGRCTELSVKAHALKGQQCVHCRLVIGDGYVAITKGESFRRFFEHAEEAEEEEDDDSTDKDGSEIDGECFRPQKHAKSPELAREFLLDAATVIFKEQVEKAFREGTARQNAHSIFVCLSLKLLEDRVHVACKEIITLEKQTKLLEEEEKEKLEEENRKERRRTKEREKKLRRKERLKEKERDKEKKFPESNISAPIDDSKQDLTPNDDEETKNIVAYEDSVSDFCDLVPSKSGSPDRLEEVSNEFSSSKLQTHEATSIKDVADPLAIDQSSYSRRRLKFHNEAQHDVSLKWSDRRRFPVVSESGANRFDSRYHNDTFRTPSRVINGSKPHARSCSLKFNEKLHHSSNYTRDGYDSYFCSCNQQNEYRTKVDTKFVRKSESNLDMSKQYHRGYKNSQIKKVWEPVELQKNYPRSNSDSDVTLKSPVSNVENVEHNSEVTGNSAAKDHEIIDTMKSSYNKDSCYMTEEVGANDKVFTSNVISEPIMSNNSNSDNCSSCLSEGDGNLESSSSTSDSEDTSQQSNVREEVSVCNQNEVASKRNHTNGNNDLLGSRKMEEVSGNDIAENPPIKSFQCSVNGVYNVATMPPMHNQNVHFPVFHQTSPTMGYYHQNPVSWPAAAANGVFPFHHANPYLFPAPFGNGFDGTSQFCMQYGSLQQLPTTPLFNPGPIPVYHPASKANGVKLEERTQVPNSPTIQKSFDEATEKTEIPNGKNGGKVGPKIQTGDASFSLFHFGGPVAHNSKVVTSDVCFSADSAGSNHSCSKEESTVEEYNLFAASNGSRFSFF